MKANNNPPMDFVRVALRSAHASPPDGHFIEVARHPTTVAEYQEFVDSDGYSHHNFWSERGWAWRRDHNIVSPTYWGQEGYNDPKQPVTGVSFWEAEAYATFRQSSLPTEQEWYLISSNNGTSESPWGNSDHLVTDDHAHLSFFGEFSAAAPFSVHRSKRSASKAGVYDLIGNVSEWVYPGSSHNLEPHTRFGVLRGGSWWNVPGGADASFRDVAPLAVRDNQTGIRLIRRERIYSLNPEQLPHPMTRPLGRSVRRPTTPFRQEGIPENLTESSWRLRISGDFVPTPREFTLQELKTSFKSQVDGGLFVCVCRWAEQNTFRGVSVSDLLEECKVRWTGSKNLYLLQRSAVGRNNLRYETTVPIREAVRRRAIFAWEMDNKPLTKELGWPLRYVDLDLYGYKCVKCVTEIVVTDQLRKGWWEEACHYDLEGLIQPGTVTVVGKDAHRLEIQHQGRVPSEQWRKKK